MTTLTPSEQLEKKELQELISALKTNPLYKANESDLLSSSLVEIFGKNLLLMSKLRDGNEKHSSKLQIFSECVNLQEEIVKQIEQCTDPQQILREIRDNLNLIFSTFKIKKPEKNKDWGVDEALILQSVSTDALGDLRPKQKPQRRGFGRRISEAFYSLRMETVSECHPRMLASSILGLEKIFVKPLMPCKVTKNPLFRGYTGDRSTREVFEISDNLLIKAMFGKLNAASIKLQELYERVFLHHDLSSTPRDVFFSALALKATIQRFEEQLRGKITVNEKRRQPRPAMNQGLGKLFVGRPRRTSEDLDLLALSEDHSEGSAPITLRSRASTSAAAAADYTSSAHSDGEEASDLIMVSDDPTMGGGDFLDKVMKGAQRSLANASLVGVARAIQSRLPHHDETARDGSESLVRQFGRRSHR